jgi:hypothetical protein
VPAESRTPILRSPVAEEEAELQRLYEPDMGRVLDRQRSPRQGDVPPEGREEAIGGAMDDAHRFGLALGLDATKNGRPGRPPEAVLMPNLKRKVTRKGTLRAVDSE